jgi:hypothetical protein
MRCGVYVASTTALPFSSSGVDGSAAPQHDNHRAAVSSVLVEKVREATAPFRDVRNVPEGYGPALGCASGPLTGAMGVHFINGFLVGDATLDPARPEALITNCRRFTSCTYGHGATTRSERLPIATRGSPATRTDRGSLLH